MLRLWRKWIIYPLFWLVLMALVAGGIALFRELPQNSEPPIASFSGTYEASLVDGRVELAVAETFVVQLYSERGLSRHLPSNYGETPVKYRDFSVEQLAPGMPGEDRNAKNDETTVSVRQPSNGDVTVAMGDNERKRGHYTFTLRYVIESAMVGTDVYQELYFNTLGHEWSADFKQFRVKLTLDDELAAMRIGEHACYIGAVGSIKRCDLTVDGATYSWESPTGMPAGESVTLAVGFEPDTAEELIPPFRGASWGWWGFALLLGIGVFVLLTSLVLRAVAGNLERGEHGVVTQIEPPEKLLPVTAADFLGRSERGAAAHLAWLVVEGHAAVYSDADALPAQPPSAAGSLVPWHQRSNLDMTWRAAKLVGFEKEVSEALFGMPEIRKPLRRPGVSDFSAAQRLRDTRMTWLGLRRPNHFTDNVFWLGYLAILALGVVQIWFGLAGEWWWFVLLGLGGVMLLVVARHIAPAHVGLTKSGREVRRHLMGLEDFVTMSEEGRISWLQGVDTAPRDEEGRLHLYEQLLPWAIVFGAERSWASTLGSMVDRFPAVVMPDLGALGRTLESVQTSADDHLHERRDSYRRSSWANVNDIDDGSLSHGVSSFFRGLGESSRGSGSDDSSWRSSGHGSSGGRSSGSGSGGSGHSGGGIGGGGGGRR